MGKGRPNRRTVHPPGPTGNGPVPEGRQCSGKLCPSGTEEAHVIGNSVGAKIGAGPVHVIESVNEIKNFKKGEVLVTEMTDPDWEPIMKIAAAIVTNRGGRTCHAAIVSRELGVPCIVGTGNGTKVLQRCQGSDRFLRRRRSRQGLRRDPEIRCSTGSTSRTWSVPKTKIMMNVGNPENAFNLAVDSQRRRRSGEAGIYHQPFHQHPPHGPDPVRQGHR